MTAIMDLSFPDQRTNAATSCIPHDSVYMRGPRAGKSENDFFRCDTWLQIFQNDSKICEAEVTLTTLINKIFKPCEVKGYKKEQKPITFWPSWPNMLDQWLTYLGWESSRAILTKSCTRPDEVLHLLFFWYCPVQCQL